MTRIAKKNIYRTQILSFFSKSLDFRQAQRLLRNVP
mgnify:CR=1 FL=1